MLKKIIKSTLRISLLLSLSIAIIGYCISRPTFVKQQIDQTDHYIDQQALKNHVIFLSQTAAPRNSEHPENLDKVAKYIKAQLSKSTDSVEFQKYLVRNKEFKNVIAKYGPESSDLIVIGAHYDSYSSFAGADDNASGVAGLIALGKLVSTMALTSQIVLVAYSLEEPPHFASKHMGSYIHASSIKNKNVKMMISLEMIGYFNDKAQSQKYPMPMMNIFYPNRGNFIAVVDEFTSNNAVALKSAINKYTDLAAYSINAPSMVPGIDFSDHRNYWSYGFPAVMLTDTAFYRNQAYHTDKDTYDRLDYGSMAKVIFGLFKYLEELNQTPDGDD
jgi:Zn-dependent M28 family amino/carboxypeptidase